MMVERSLKGQFSSIGESSCMPHCHSLARSDAPTPAREVKILQEGDELKVTIRFQTLRRSAKERIYVLARADAEHLFSLLRPHMESNALAEVIRGAHQCVRCGSQFTLTSAQARAGAGVTCPHCGSDVVLKVDSCKEKVPASQPTTTTTRPTGSLSPGSSSGTSTPIARSTSQPPTEDSDGVEVVSETSSIEVVMDSNTLQKQSKLPEPLDEVAEEAVTTESSLSTPRVAETDRHQTSGPPASGANVMSESNSSGSMTASTTTQIDKEDRLTEEEKSPPPPAAVLSETPVREETGVAEEQPMGLSSPVSPRSPSLSSLKNRTSLSHPVTPAKRQQLAPTAQNPRSESKSDTLRNISSLLERHARKTQEMEALSNSTDSDSSSSREYSLGLLLAQVGQLRGSALGQSPANRGVSIEDLQHVSLNSKIPAYSWEQPDGKLDHRLQLYCEVVLFRESSEFVLTVHRCEMWVSSAAGLQPSLLVISNKKVYFLRIHGMESESPSSWLTLVHSFHCTQLRCVSLTLCSQALLMTFAQTPSKPPLLLVTRDAVRTQTLVRLIHEKFPSLGAVVSSSDSSPVHCGRLSAITKAFLSDEDSASSADIVSTFICFVKASPRESWESCIMSLTSSHILLTTCDLDWIITEDGSNPEVKDFRPINSLVGLESYQPLPSCLGLHFIDADSTDVLETQWRVAFEKDFQSFLETLSPYWSAAFHQELKLTEGVL
ncbi:unnamed protein product [Cyprideis torosa]|uniref:PLEKHM2 PH domain-containing protein n=1 Tax=Cyprideis torosa TaxID=163714 RepID=A0A7R8ZP46_9CRUS|nr:unnamed protein product [Cyprideis torosa]CAG0893074.1 unnamed protein product [Cyprideis torosa]